MATKNNLQASAYAGRAKEAMPALAAKTNHSKLDTYDVSLNAISKSAGDEQTKTTGVVTRGNGCAIKGITARGPMA